MLYEVNLFFMYSSVDVRTGVVRMVFAQNQVKLVIASVIEDIMAMTVLRVSFCGFGEGL